MKTRIAAIPEGGRRKEEERGETGRVAVMRSGYNQPNPPNPPDDDCCPICFGSFSIPCQALCASCILRCWRHGKSFRCQCPMCGDKITTLRPHASSLIQAGEDEIKILKEVKQYNRVCFWTFMKKEYAQMYPSFSEMRRRFRETWDHREIKTAYELARIIAPLLLLVFHCCGFKFPFEIMGILVFVTLCSVAVVLFFILDVAWYEWTLQRVRRQEEAAEEQPREN